MGLKQILQNFSWETLINLPPSDLLALIVLGAPVVYVLFLVVAFYYKAATAAPTDPHQ